MKHYFVKYYGFGNVYNLIYTSNAAEEETAKNAGYERITRREACKLCAAENYRRKYDGAFSHYADNLIYPIWFDEEKHDIHTIEGYLVID